MALAHEWEQMMVAKGLTRAGLARRLGVSRARVTQVLNLLALEPEIVAAIAGLGNPMPKRLICERDLRPLVSLAKVEQRRRVQALLTEASSP